MMTRGTRAPPQAASLVTPAAVGFEESYSPKIDVRTRCRGRCVCCSCVRHNESQKVLLCGKRQKSNLHAKVSKPRWRLHIIRGLRCLFDNESSNQSMQTPRIHPQHHRPYSTVVSCAASGGFSSPLSWPRVCVPKAAFGFRTASGRPRRRRM